MDWECACIFVQSVTLHSWLGVLEKSLKNDCNFFMDSGNAFMFKNSFNSCELV